MALSTENWMQILLVGGWHRRGEEVDEKVTLVKGKHQVKKGEKENEMTASWT